ncbi:MAG TPA: DUF3592 domain-containing protein [Croceibacterium sp.]|nr:DUF3592 domain-containing protein [Croceibacterium sp.]
MKTWIKLALIFALLAAGTAWLLLDAQQREARMTAKGTALVTAVTFKPDDESSSLDETEFALRVTAGERSVETTDTLPGDRRDEFREGHTFTVCYNPADPAEADIELDPAVACGA